MDRKYQNKNKIHITLHFQKVIHFERNFVYLASLVALKYCIIPKALEVT